jgi:hypothetical protein
VWIGACATALLRGRLPVMAAGIGAIAAVAWVARGPLPWRAEAPGRRAWIWSAACFTLVVAVHLFNRSWNAKSYFPVHVAASVFSLTFALFGAAHFWRALRRGASWRPLSAAVAGVALAATLTSSLVFMRLSNDVRHVLFARAFEAKAVLYVARKLRGDGSRSATAMPAAASGPAAPGRKRVDRVLLISIDTVRADHLPSYGYRRDTAPAMARLAAASTVFDWAWSVGAMTSLVLDAILGPPGAHPSLGQQLERAGVPRLAVVMTPFVPWTSGMNPVVVPVSAGDAGVAEAAAREIEGGRFGGFLWVHFLDPHRPYERHPGEQFGDQPVDLYDGEIRSSDRAVGRVLDALARAHLEDSTAVILLADHGEEFGEHGGEAHGWDIYNELVHVPLVIRIPGGRAGHVRTHVTQRDLPLTITDLLGVGQQPARLDRSLVPLVLGEQRADDRAVTTVPISSFDVGLVMAGRWKLAYCLANDSRALFDLAADPQERVNLFEARPPVARRMEALLQRSLADPARTGPPLVADGPDLAWPAARPQ